MTKKLTWAEISDLYKDEWVELVDYEWEEMEPDPRAGVVRLHSKDSQEFHNLISNAPAVDSALVYVGKIKIPEGVTISSNLHQFAKWP